ncbi:MAG: cation transporter [Pseudomonadota bacterium]
MSNRGLHLSHLSQRKTLWVVLAINLALTAGFAVAGVIGDSSSLLANALDNASDSMVFMLSLIALSHGLRWKIGAARVSGYLLLLFAAGILVDALRRFIDGSAPLGLSIMVMGIIGAVANALCFWLLHRLRHKDVNLRAATTFSFNDFASNGGLFVAGALVLWTGSNWPDLLVGVAVAALAIKGGAEILRDANEEAAGGNEESAGAAND